MGCDKELVRLKEQTESATEIDTTTDRDRTKTNPGLHGNYFVAPDSCDPFPDDFWGEVDHTAIVTQLDIIERATPSKDSESRLDRTGYLVPRVFRLGDAERNLLELIGESGDQILGVLDELDGTVRTSPSKY